MDKIKEKVQKMIAASSCCEELKNAGQAWLDAVGTNMEVAATANLMAEIDEDVTSIDNLIAFAGSETGIQVFGEETAAGILAHAKELAANGAKYCDCPGCTAALEVKNMLI